MKKIAKHIEIVRSDVGRFSSMGEKSCAMIQATLSRSYQRVGITTINNVADLEGLVALQPDLVFLGMKTMPSDTGSNIRLKKITWLTTYLSEHGLNYTGSTQPAMVLDYDKLQAKEQVKKAGLPTAPFFQARVGQYRQQSQLPLSFPLFVKPPSEGGGKGIGDDCVVRNFSEFTQKVQDIWDEFQTTALVETYLSGREFSVALMQTNTPHEILAMPIELVTPKNIQGDSILGGQIKSEDTEHVLAVASGDVRDKVIALAIDVFLTLGARDYGRIDIRMDEHDQPYFLEANLIPGLAEHDFTSYFTSACRINRNISYAAMILDITALGIKRSTAGTRTTIQSKPYKQLAS